MKNLFLVLFVGLVYSSALEAKLLDSIPGVRKIKDVIIYEDNDYYSCFPSVVRRPNGEYIVAFRRAPNRELFGESGNNHVDPNSFLVKVRSTDGEHWTSEPELIYAHPYGGSQDPCLLQLRDGSLICTSYGWAFVRPEGMENMEPPYSEPVDGVVFLGGYYLRSSDGGQHWQGPYYPPHIPPEVKKDAMGKPLAAYNRGALCEGKDGRIFWAVAAGDDAERIGKTSNYLLISEDKGLTWDYSCPIAIDDSAYFNETSMYETPKGDLVAFLRTAKMDGEACMARSTDGGKSFEPWQKMGFKGHPFQALRLPDNRVLLTYGYRHKPYGIRARILNAECTDFLTAPEIVLREDGGSTDIGYTWATRMDDNRVLVTYYYNLKGGTRHIAGTILEID